MEEGYYGENESGEREREGKDRSEAKVRKPVEPIYMNSSLSPLARSNWYPPVSALRHLFLCAQMWKCAETPRTALGRDRLCIFRMNDFVNL